MKKTVVLLIFFMLAGFFLSCSGISEKGEGAVTVKMEPGKEWIHSFNFMIHNPPQFAFWLEDEEGHYLETLYVTEKTATEGWMANSGNRRVESLPVWTHRRNIEDESGFLMPSKENPVADTFTGATPRDAFYFSFDLPEGYEKVFFKLEINHSTDFNETWSKNAEPGTEQWSGGEEGSGQPSLIYSAAVNLSSTETIQADLTGHGSSDGSDGKIYPETEGFTTALSILEKVTISW